jgi:alkanesulfonate monooxygenase SsuD/methylene tetrahydromethanopterin reductase-like flavin-dependent oxidoreductase (luciferase family)
VKFGVMTLPTAPWDEMVRRWRTLDTMRFETIWTADHLLGVRAGGSWFEGWASLAGIAHATERTRIGTLVSPITFHNPARLVKAAVTVDHMSGGRLELGLGAGGSLADHELAQVEAWPRAERARRLRAFFERVDELLRDERLQPRPLQPRIPLTIGGMARGTLRLAAQLADRWSSFGGERGTQPEAAAAAARALAAAT